MSLSCFSNSRTSSSFSFSFLSAVVAANIPASASFVMLPLMR
nr:MAG TPA: hypothetical protein [Caudoviricetes sp.]